jgi:hypothetical protein
LWCLLIVAANLADPPWDGRAGEDSYTRTFSGFQPIVTVP